MKEAYMFIKRFDETQRTIDWDELNQLKKDILWVFDENFGDIINAFVPAYSFKLNYWEYLTLDGDNYFHENQKTFYHTGALIILLCCCSEYIDIAGGSQDVFDRDDLPQIIDYIKSYRPLNDQQILITEKVLLGLRIIQSMTSENLMDNEFVHEKTAEYYDNLNEIGNTVIENYYKEMVVKRIKSE